MFQSIPKSIWQTTLLIAVVMGVWPGIATPHLDAVARLGCAGMAAWRGSGPAAWTPGGHG